jgi:glyoxylase-like metal-dependent hydrolase (beta-lactamase superfamily II)
VPQAFDVCYDCMGDGSMILLPTPGHSRDSMYLLVRSSDSPPLLFVGDLTYELEPLRNDQIPGNGITKQLKASFAKVRRLEKALPGLVVVPSHDPFASEKFAKALGLTGAGRSRQKSHNASV